MCIASQINETTKPEDLALIVENSLRRSISVVSLQKELQEKGASSDEIEKDIKLYTDRWLNKYTGDSPGIIKESLDKDNFIEVAYCTEANKLDTATGAERQKSIVEYASYNDYTVMQNFGRAEQKFSECFGYTVASHALNIMAQKPMEQTDSALINKLQTVEYIRFLRENNSSPDEFIAKLDPKEQERLSTPETTSLFMQDIIANHIYGKNFTKLNQTEQKKYEFSVCRIERSKNFSFHILATKNVSPSV